MAGPGRHPVPVVVLLGGAVAFGETEEGSTEGVVDELQQGEQVTRSVRQRCPGKGMYDGIPLGLTHEASRQPRPLRRVVLQIVGLVEDETTPAMGEQVGDVALEQVVVDDDPAGIRRIRRRRRTDDVHRRLRQDDVDLPLPVVLHRGRADDEPGTVRLGVGHGQHGLTGLAQSHVVGQDRAPPTQQEGEALHLVWVQALGQSLGAGGGVQGYGTTSRATA